MTASCKCIPLKTFQGASEKWTSICFGLAGWTDSAALILRTSMGLASVDMDSFLKRNIFRGTDQQCCKNNTNKHNLRTTKLCKCEAEYIRYSFTAL